MKDILYRIIFSTVLIIGTLFPQVANGQLKKTVRIGSVTYYEIQSKEKKASDEEGKSSRDIENDFERALEKYMEKNGYKSVRIEVVESK